MKAIHDIKHLALCTLAVGSLTAVTGSLCAQDVPVALNISLVGYVQNPETTPTSIGLVKDSVSAVKLTSASVLTLIQSAIGTNYPTGLGVRLALMNGEVLIMDKTLSTTLTNLSQGNYFGIQQGIYSAISTTTIADNSVFLGVSYTNTAGVTIGGWTSLASPTISFDDGNGTAFTVAGYAKNTQSYGVADAKGNQKEVWSVVVTASGNGTYPELVDKVVMPTQTFWTGAISGSGWGIVNYQ